MNDASSCAPMLAAVAAAYDKFGETGLRLAVLDEVPAEVDERGREGPTRFFAELDLDLVCTSRTATWVRRRPL